MKINISRHSAPNTQIFVHTIAKDMLGEGRPVVFILPGGPGADHSVYMKYACLSDVADLVFHDPRGCGQSDKGEPSTYTMNNYIDDVEAIRQHFSLEKIMVLGKSYGAMCALGYALRYPAAVTKLILSAGAPSARFLETAKKNVRRLGTPEQVAVCEKLWSGSFRSREEVLNYFQLMNPLYSVKARNSESKTDLIKKSQQFSYEVLNEGFKRSFWHFDYENELQKVLCPTLILAGREDWIADIQYSEFMVARIPHSELRVFEHASHAMEADAPEEYFQTIADFIQY